MNKVRHRYIGRTMAALLAAALLLAGCGDPSRTSGASGLADPAGEEAETVNYRITERLIPSPEEELYKGALDNETYFLMDSYSAGQKLCYLYRSDHEEGGSDRSGGDYYLCVLEQPYEQWSVYTIDPEGWSEETGYWPDSIAGVSEEGIYLSLSTLDENNYLYPACMGLYGWDGSHQLLEKLPPDPGSGWKMALYPAGETLYSVAGYSVTSYDERLKPSKTRELKDWISGCFAYDSEILWYGFDEEQELTVWDKPDGKKLFSLGDMVNVLSEFGLNRASDGGFIMADVSGIWKGNGDAPLKRVLAFSEKGYILEEILILIPEEDGSLSLVVSFEDALYLLTVEETETVEKQEITLVAYGANTLESVAAAFNRKSEEYQITLIDPSDAEDRDAYLLELQMEMASGGGPDLVSPWIFGSGSVIENSYLEPLDDIIEDPSAYWEVCLEEGKTDGVLYHVPYLVGLTFLAASESLTGDLESWDLEQLMTAVRNSPAETLEIDMDSMDIVLYYGLMTADNPQFIDYEAGISHLTEQPFLDFLEFARDYKDELYYTTDDMLNYYAEAAEYYGEGRIAIHHTYLSTFHGLLLTPECFQGRESLIGWPSPQGKGVMMSADTLCLNANSSCKEGAKEFLRYLVSEEGQLRFVQSYNNMEEDIVFSCRRDVTEEALEIYQNMPKVQKADQSYISRGVEYTIAPLSEEQIAQLWALFEDAKPAFSMPEEIYTIACEELAPYFAGDCSAEEAAAKMHNRVQLYFDENK